MIDRAGDLLAFLLLAARTTPLRTPVLLGLLLLLLSLALLAGLTRALRGVPHALRQPLPIELTCRIRKRLVCLLSLRAARAG